MKATDEKALFKAYANRITKTIKQVETKLESFKELNWSQSQMDNIASAQAHLEDVRDELAVLVGDVKASTFTKV